MCGIYGLIQYTQCRATRRRVLDNVKKTQSRMKHRGPDWEGQYQSKNEDNVFMAHHRLSIIDPLNGSQPIVWNFDDFNKDWLTLAVNGEIYNSKDLESESVNGIELKGFYNFKTGSDCECIMAQYQYIIEKCNIECLYNASTTTDESYNESLTYEDMKNEPSKARRSSLPNINLGASKGLNSDKWNTQLKKELFTLLNKITGMFAFILYDNVNKMVLVARDPMGICPLYYGFDSYGGIHFASEMKAMPDDVIPQVFLAGHYMYFSTSKIKDKPVLCRYYTELLNTFARCSAQGLYNQSITLKDEDLQMQFANCRSLLTKAVAKRLRTDVPFGMLLSGGLDSSLVCSIACKLINKDRDKLDTHMNATNQITTFAIGLEGGPDLIAAEKVAKFLGTKHYGFTFTVEEGLNALRDVIWHLETYDMTTIRASTPMFLLSRKIKALGIKMLLSGEGADEAFSGYLYFHNAPNNLDHAIENLRRLQELQFSDNLRANKSTMAWGIEARVPFEDKELVEWSITLPPECKTRNGIEKWVLRSAFDTKTVDGENEYLPDEILWRQKDQFSDAVGYNWIDSIKELAEREISDYVMSLASDRWKVNPPVQKDEYLVRAIFEELYPGRGRDETVHKSTPNTAWKGVSYDSSGRAQKVHASSNTWKA
jgi:asparagine synthase (glutamine-hydrolysing)